MTGLFDPTVFAAVGLGGPAAYSVQGGQPVELEWAQVQEGSLLGRAGTGFDSEFAPGLGRFAEARVIASELLAAGVEAPAFGDTLTQDGVSWRVEQSRNEGGMWVLMVSSDQRGSR